MVSPFSLAQLCGAAAFAAKMSFNTLFTAKGGVKIYAAIKNLLSYILIEEHYYKKPVHNAGMPHAYVPVLCLFLIEQRGAEIAFACIWQNGYNTFAFAKFFRKFDCCGDI